MHLEGKQTFIRTLVKNDLPFLVKWKNDSIIAEMVLGNPIVTTLDNEEKRFEKSLEEHETIRLIIETKEALPIGFISICEIDKLNRKVQLGMLIGEKQYWGKGFGTDALYTLLDYLLNKLGFNRVGVEVFQFNKRAQRLYRKLGFVEEGLQRQGLCKDGVFEDIVLMSLLKQDFSTIKTKNTTKSGV